MSAAPIDTTETDIRLAIADTIQRVLINQDNGREPLRLLQSEQLELGEAVLAIVAAYQLEQRS